jgi:hypothetical protein
MKYISAWDYSDQKVASPNGKYLAEVHSVCEFRMSGPIIGNLKVSGGITHDSVGVSVCWSADSRLIAVPVLKASEHEFKILLIDVLSRTKRWAPGAYGPIAIKEVTWDKIVIVQQNGSGSIIDISKIKW